MKKIFSLIVGVVTIGVVGISSFAAGFTNPSGNMEEVRPDTEKSVKAVELTKLSNTFNYAHYDGDGHSYHQIIQAAKADAAARTFTCEVYGCLQTTEHIHTVCPVSGCTKTASHEHDGILYYGHHDEDGHDHGTVACTVTGCTQTGEHAHNLCSVSGCTDSTTHEHDGIFYYGHHNEDGHGHGSNGSAAYSAAGCTQTGNHSHNSSSGHGNKGHGGRHH